MNPSTPIGPARAAWLLVRLRLARLFNQVGSGLLRFRRKGTGGQRGATAGKSKIGWLVGSLVGLSMLFSFTNLAIQAVSHMQERLGSETAAPTKARAEPVAPQGWLGAQLNNLTKAEAEALGWDRPRGAKVIGSAAGSPAARAGLVRDDILIALDDRDIANAANLIRMISAKAPGAVVELRLLRAGKEQRLRVTLSPRPPPLASTQSKRTQLPAAPGYGLASGVLQACVFEACILLLATLLMSLASREFTLPDWDLEWLVTFPVSLSTLLGVRILERTLVNPAGFLTLWPFLSVVAWAVGYRVAAPVLGLAVTMLLLVISTTVWTVLDAGLRLRVSSAKLRNLQALVSVTAVGCLYLAMSAGMSTDSYVLHWASGLPSWMFWLPPGLAIGALTSSEPAGTGLALLGLTVETLVFVALGFAILRHQLRLGVVGVAGRESGGRGSPKKLVPGSTAGGTARRILLSPIQARELQLLGRDRNFLIQTLVLPVVILGAQVFFNAPGSAFAAGLGTPEHVAAAAFGIAAYALMFSAFQTLNTEGQALWILYSVPHSLEAVLREKATLWGTVCLIYAVAVLGLGLAFNPAFSLQQLELMVVVLLGVPIFATIGAALGVFACDPLAQLVQRRVRPSYLYLYMLLASLYVYAIYASNVWQRMGLVVLTALLGMALWQKARDQLPYLLDPDASPPARVSVADGLMAALLFFVLQGLIAVVLSYGEAQLTGRVVLIAFSVAGAVTYGCMRFAYWRLKTEGVPRMFGPRLGGAAAWGVVGGAMAAVGALIYLKIAAHTSLFEDVRENIFTGRDDLLWLTLLAVAAAPVFEEFIFRGLIFGGLRRSLGLSASVMASAAIFALVHPAPSVIPVFGLGVATALVYERTGNLLGPMVVHGVYNAAVVAYQALH